jgi:GTPase SAR1 family protein
MRIAFMGAQSVGKSTLIEGFLDQWPMYKKPETSYRDIIEEKKLKINKKGTEKSQKIILDALIDEVQQSSKTGNKYNVYDRCVVDNIAYSLWLNANKKVSDNFIVECKTIAAESLKLYDIIFYLPIHKDIKVEEKKNRETDLQYRQEIDNIFQALVTSYEKSTGRFFPLSDCPAVITLDKHPLARLDQIKLYINEHGNMYGEDTPSLITPFYS